MKLHTYPDEFRDLSAIVAGQKHIPESAVVRDYYIVMMLQRLTESLYGDSCVFKGGTSLSKCYPGSIERFSEDIDLTYMAPEAQDAAIERALKNIEALMAQDAQKEIIPEERNKRNKSSYIWFDTEANKIKLEIGSRIRPEPYSRRLLKTYIQEFLEEIGADEDVARFELTTVEMNVLNIERTFLDKVFAVKRHAICGSLKQKSRHIYDVVRLYTLPEIQAFLRDKDGLRQLVQKTKETDSFYLQKRNLPGEYNPGSLYSFRSWQQYFDADVRATYESLHKTLLYTDEKQDFDTAVAVFECIDKILSEIGE